MGAGLKLIIRKLNQLIDESGSDNLENKDCLLTLMLHEQAINISESILLYERSLSEKSLPEIQFHASPPLNSRKHY